MELSTNDIVLRYEANESERENLDGQYELIERFVMPGRGRFFEEGHDEEESIRWTHREIFDGTANNALIILSSSLHGSLTSASTQWFNLTFRQAGLNDNREASAWLEDCGQRVMAGIQESDFNLEANELYQDACGFGTGYLLHTEREGPTLEWNGHNFRSEMLRNAFFEEGFDRKVHAMYIKRSYTPRQLVDKFGYAALPQRVQEKARNPGTGAAKNEDVIYALYLDYDKRGTNISTVLAPEARPIIGRYVLVNGRTFLGPEERYYTMPAYVLRWQRTAGSKYGHCPGLVSLGDILTLQEMVRLLRDATEKTVDPPMKSTRRNIVGDLETYGGGITLVRNPEGLLPLVPPGAYRVDTGWTDVNDVRDRIRRQFFVDQLELKESPQMTAEEVRTRYEMMQRLLGPTLGRIQADFLDPLIQNSFWMMYRKGALEPPPQIVQEQMGDLDIDYVGPLARAQRTNVADNIDRWIGELGTIARAKPEILDVPDFDEIARYLADVRGVPAKLLNAEAVIKKTRDDRQKRMEQQMKMEQLQQGAGAAKDLAGAAGAVGAGNGASAPA